MALRCAAEDQTGDVFDGVLAIDPNLTKDTCVMTGLFSQLDPSVPDNVVGLLQNFVTSCNSIDDWVISQGHVVNCVDKFSSDLSILVRQCQDIANPFFDVQSGQPSPFVQWYRRAADQAGHVHCIFADDAQKRAIIAEVRMQHLQNNCLGDRFTSDAFAFISESHHLDLMRPDAFRQHMDDLMSAVRPR
jgi:hypothetical protein